MDQEMRLHRYAIGAAQAFARANHIDKVVLDAPHARLGIVTTGKSYLDVLQALEYLGLDAQACAQIGLRVYKVGMTWPLEPVGISAFAQGLEDIVVVEEKSLHRAPDEGAVLQLAGQRRRTAEHCRQIR